MAVIAIRCRCGNTHRIECSKTAAAAWAAGWPRPRRGDCRTVGRTPNTAPPEPAYVALQPQPLRAELALGFC